MQPLSLLFLFSSVHTCPRPADERTESERKAICTRKPILLKAHKKKNTSFNFCFISLQHFISNCGCCEPTTSHCFLSAGKLPLVGFSEERRHRAVSACFCLPVVGGKSAERKLLLIHTTRQCREDRLWNLILLDSQLTRCASELLAPLIQHSENDCPRETV